MGFSFWWFELGTVLLGFCFNRHVEDGDVLLPGVQLQDAVLGVYSACLCQDSGSGIQFGQNSSAPQDLGLVGRQLELWITLVSFIMAAYLSGLQIL